MDIDQQVKELKKKAKLLEDLKKAFPNIREYKNRWGHVHYCTKDVIPMVDAFESIHDCGCCEDSPLYIKPYILFGDGKTRIYTDPVEICVGEKCPWTYGDRWDENWYEKFEQLGFSNDFIGRVEENYLKDKKRLEAYEQYQAELDNID